MSEQTTPAELGEIISTASFVLGISAGYEEVVKKLREMAGQKFAIGNDDLAHAYRDLAEELERIGKVRRAEYDKERRPEKERAFRELEALENKKAG